MNMQCKNLNKYCAKLVTKDEEFWNPNFNNIILADASLLLLSVQ